MRRWLSGKQRAFPGWESWSIMVGERITCQERLFDMREGVTRKDDTLPKRLLKEPVPDDSAKGSIVPLEKLLDDYYQAMNWDLSAGGPTDAVLEKLEIAK